MARVTVEIPDETILREISLRAAIHKRSLEVEIGEIVRAALSSDRQPAKFRALAEEIAARISRRPQSDSTELLREDRQR